MTASAWRPSTTRSKLLWDAEKGEITNIPEANRSVKPTCRKGWELSL